MASGHMNRVKRPDTWLHRPMLRNVKKVLANPEPSTHDPIRTLPRQRLLELHLHNCDAFVRKRRACRIPNGSSRRASLR
jgi:hypothetical protein